MKQLDLNHDRILFHNPDKILVHNLVLIDNLQLNLHLQCKYLDLNSDRIVVQNPDKIRQDGVICAP